MKPELTDAQVKVVTSASGHLLVHAGAGSGKTTTIVQFLARQLGVPLTTHGVLLDAAPSPLVLEQVAAITYTNQAAADLKRKLRTALRTAGQRHLAADVDSAMVGTIHGFCGDLLREYALRAGDVPGRSVLEEGQAAVLLAESARMALRQAIEHGDVQNLDMLLAGRRLDEIARWVAVLAGDSQRLGHLAAAAQAGGMRPHERALIAIAQQAVVLHGAQLDRAGAMDFDRMIVATRNMLRSAPVRHAVQRRLRLLVLDEFQDVDPVQREIAYLLGGLEHADPNPTRLVLVGDPKQSIYGFRRADVTLWNGVARDFEAGRGGALPLGANFRCKAAILAFVDHVLTPLMNAPVADDEQRRPFEVDYQSLEARAEHAEGNHAVEILAVPAAADGKRRNAGEVRALEFQAVAQRIRELHLQGRAYGDIAILLAGWGAADVLAESLKAAGVPFYILRSEGFWDAREVVDCVLALRAIRDPRDDVAVAGFLKSPFIGVRDGTLLAIAQARQDGEALCQAMRRVSCEQPLLQLAQSLLDRLGALRDRVTVHDVLMQLLDETAFRVAAVMDPRHGQQALGNLRKLLRLAAGSADRSLGEFLRMIAEQRTSGERVAPERLYRERADVVTISSVHSAKGLEWPVVFWCDLIRELKRPTEKLLVGRETIALKVQGDEGDADTKDATHEGLATALAAETMAEAYRLWYVASTRARELLVVSGVALGTPRGRAFSPASQLLTVLPPLDENREIEYRSSAGTLFHANVRLCDAAAVIDNAGETDTALPGHHALEAMAASLPLPPAVVSVPLGPHRLSASQLMVYARDPKRWHDRYVLLLQERRAHGQGGGAPDAAVAGAITHDVLALLGREGADIDELMESAIASSDPEIPDAESAIGWEFRMWVRARVQAAAQAPAWQAFASLPTARRELSFTRLMPDGTVMHGAMDLVARDGDRVRILDVKSGEATAGDLAARYAIQADTYRDAVRAIAATNQVEFALLQVPSGAEVPVPRDGTPVTVIERLRSFSGLVAGPA